MFLCEDTCGQEQKKHRWQVFSSHEDLAAKSLAAVDSERKQQIAVIRRASLGVILAAQFLAARKKEILLLWKSFAGAFAR